MIIFCKVLIESLTIFPGKIRMLLMKISSPRTLSFVSWKSLGEATKQISEELRKKNPEVPWSEMAGMQDILIHDYIDVDLDIVWKTASESINDLKDLLGKIAY